MWRADSRGGAFERFSLLVLLLTLLIPGQGLAGQARHVLLPGGGVRLPSFLAGPREPVASGSLLVVSRNPNQLGSGLEAEVSLGNSLPILLLNREQSERHILLGIEAAVYARFGLQILERELVATDWFFAVPVVWVREKGWIRLRFFHSSSHMGDEYSRRFEERGVNFSRDAADLFLCHRGWESLDVYGGVRFAYNVKPEDSRRWVVRGGAQREWPDEGQSLLPWTAVDLEWDQDAGDPRVDVRIGAWLPAIDGRRRVRFSVGVLVGPSPLGQFQGKGTAQFSLGLTGNL